MTEGKSLTEARRICSICKTEDNVASMVIVVNKRGDELYICRDCVYKHWAKLLEPSHFYVQLDGDKKPRFKPGELLLCCSTGPECFEETKKRMREEEKDD